MSVEIRPAASFRDVGTFVKLPFRLYSNEPNWVPPLVVERRMHVSKRFNPFFDHGEAQLFLAYRDGRAVGRISAHVDHAFNEYQGHAWGCFGFFECEDDAEAARALVQAAEEWLRARGRDRMVGPMDFTTNDEFGVLTEGHEHKPMIRQPWQLRYYPELLESAGLGKAVDLLMWALQVSDRTKVLPIVWELAEQLEPKHGIRVRHMRKKDFAAEMDRFAEIYNAAWKDNWGFAPMRGKEVFPVEAKPLLSEEWMMIAEKDGEVVGAALTVPDFNVMLAAARGRLLPLGWYRALRARRRIDQVRVGWLGVKPEHQHAGVAAGLYARHFDVAETSRQNGGEMGWILEQNTAMNRGMEAMGARIVKRYRVYERLFS